jgi:DNA-binding response OmpR family regulator
MAGQHILVVDDDHDTLVLVGMVLEGQDYRVTQAESGPEAVEAALLDTPDLIILDVMMPKIDGYDVARQLRAEPATAHVPILMFSAKGRVEDKAAGYEAGVDDYLTKPVHPAKMLARVKATLERMGGGPAGPDAPRGVVLACVGALPGVGVSTVATSLSLALREAGSVVILVQETPPGEVAVPSEAEVGPQIRQWLDRLDASLTEDPFGLWRLSAPGLTLDEGLWLAEGAAQLGDAIVLDLGAAYERVARWLPNAADQVVLVVGPTRRSLLAADDIVRSLRERNVAAAHIGGVLVHRDPEDEAVDVAAVRRGLGVDMLGVVPAAPDAFRAAEEAGTPLLLHAPDCPAAQSLRRIALNLRAQLGLE